MSAKLPRGEECWIFEKEDFRNARAPPGFLQNSFSQIQHPPPLGSFSHIQSERNTLPVSPPTRFSIAFHPPMGSGFSPLVTIPFPLYGAHPTESRSWRGPQRWRRRRPRRICLALQRRHHCLLHASRRTFAAAAVPRQYKTRNPWPVFSFRGLRQTRALLLDQSFSVSFSTAHSKTRATLRLVSFCHL